MDTDNGFVPNQNPQPYLFEFKHEQSEHITASGVTVSLRPSLLENMAARFSCVIFVLHFIIAHYDMYL